MTLSSMKDNAFLEKPKLDKGLLMGSSRYEWVIRTDRNFRKLTGHGLDHFSIPLHEVADRFKEKQGSAIDMSREVASELVEDLGLPTIPNIPGKEANLDMLKP